MDDSDEISKLRIQHYESQPEGEYLFLLTELNNELDRTGLVFDRYENAPVVMARPDIFYRVRCFIFPPDRVSLKNGPPGNILFDSVPIIQGPKDMEKPFDAEATIDMKKGQRNV